MVELEHLVRAIGPDRVRRRIRIGADTRDCSVRPTRSTDIAVGVGPAARVPGPADAAGGELVTDRRAGLRRQLRRPLERLVRGLDRVDRVVAASAVRHRRRAHLRQLAVQDRTGRGVQRRGGRHPVRVDDRVVRRRSAGPCRRRRRDQPLMVEVRAAKGGLEEIIRDRVVRMVPAVQVVVDRQGACVVVALRQAGGVAAGRVPVLPAFVELVLLRVEAVHDVPRAAARQVGRAGRQPIRREHAGLRTGARIFRDVLLDRERRVEEVADE